MSWMSRFVTLLFVLCMTGTGTFAAKSDDKQDRRASRAEQRENAREKRAEAREERARKREASSKSDNVKSKPNKDDQQSSKSASKPKEDHTSSNSKESSKNQSGKDKSKKDDEIKSGQNNAKKEPSPKADDQAKSENKSPSSGGNKSANKGEANNDKERQAKLDDIQKKLDILKDSPSGIRLGQFTPEQIAEIKRQGKLDELNRYVDKGGRKPELEKSDARKADKNKEVTKSAQADTKQIDQTRSPKPSKDQKAGEKAEVLDEKSGHWVANSKKPEPASKPNSPSGAESVARSQPQTTPSITPQASRQGGVLTSSEAIKSSVDQEWVAGLTRPQRGDLGKYTPEHLAEIQKSGKWEVFKKQIEGGGASRNTGGSTAVSSTPSVDPGRGTAVLTAASQTKQGPVDPRFPGDQLAKMKLDQLALLSQEQLRNLPPDRATSLERYRQGLSDAARYKQEASAAQQKVQKIERGLDGAQIVLGVAGEAPIVGAIPDTVNAGISLGRGDKAGAVLDATAALPGPTGAVVGVAQVARRADRLVVESLHLLPRAFKSQFEKAGLNIEHYRVDLSRADHRLKPDGLHTGNDNWNQNWQQFFQLNPSATKQQILNELELLKRKFEIN